MGFVRFNVNKPELLEEILIPLLVTETPSTKTWNKSKARLSVMVGEFRPSLNVSAKSLPFALTTALCRTGRVKSFVEVLVIAKSTSAGASAPPVS